MIIMENGFPLVFSQSYNDRLCSCMSSIFQRNVFSYRSVRFLKACEQSFQLTAQALSSLQSSPTPPMLLLMRDESEFHTNVAENIREVLACCCGSTVDGRRPNDRSDTILLVDVCEVCNEQQISDILDAFDKRPIYVITLHSNPLICLHPLLVSSPRIVGIVVVLPDVQYLEQIASQSFARTSMNQTLMFVNQFSAETLKIVAIIQQRLPNAICLLLPHTDKTLAKAMPAFLARVILQFVLFNQQMVQPRCRM